MKVFFSILSLLICSIILTFFIGCFYSYNYPMKYKEEIMTYSKEFNIDGAIIASVANVESNFREEVESNKGAIGVMQLLPSTAEWIANKLDEDYDVENLKKADYNLKLGSYFLSYLINYFDEMELGICAYNAGQGNVRAWLKDKHYSKDGKKLDFIPFNETKNYLNKVLKSYNYYKNRYN